MALHAGVPVVTGQWMLGPTTDEKAYWHSGVERERDYREPARFEVQMASSTTEPGPTESTAPDAGGS